MDTDDPHWREIVDLMRRASAKNRGYAEYWAWPLDRKLEEEHVASALVHFLTTKNELANGVLTSWTPDPPDVLLTTHDGIRVGIEVTELVDSKMAKLHRQLKEQGQPISYEWAPWTPDSIATELSTKVAVKDWKLRKTKGDFDTLLLAIFTDEPIIDDVIGRRAVMLSRAVADVIDRAFLILSYHPQADEAQFPDRCPVLEIPLQRPI
jgi:hypothetical protein